MSCGGVVRTGGAIGQAISQLPLDHRGQLLAQFYAPLIEGVNAPDHALDINLVLVEREQGAQRGRIDRRQ